ncbi:MAG TPA: hypothetical protein VFN57_15640 [Thermomicrobiaceae bacterium]|nr:hypothetical protein [Thermomicrobiaceae bacterium]
MMRLIDGLIDRITMYRLVLYVLIAFVALGAVAAAAGKLAFSPVMLLLSTGFLVLMCWAANTLLGRVFDVPTNIESALVTALILALIMDPPRSANDLIALGWAAILAMGSKYILALHNKHLFNPAAIAAVVVGFALKDPASWWIGTVYMFPPVLIGGLLIVRKVRQEAMAGSFVLAALVAETAASVLQHLSITTELQQLVIASPLVFFAAIMLTEPLTAPPTRGLRQLYGALTGVLFTPQLHLGSIYSTPEIALVLGNVFSYLVSPKEKYLLRLKRRTRLSPDTFDFAFQRPPALAFAPGQYMEWTLGFPGADSRGNRRFFTLASSPTERTLHLGVKFYEKGSTYKQAMLGLNSRTTILAGQVAGDFTLPADPDQKLAFVAGGIGITPFRSMLKYLVDTGEKRDVLLIYACRTVDDIVYTDVLDDAYRQLGIPTYYTLTDAATVPKKWTGYVGRVDHAMIAQLVPDFSERTFYLSGPPEMVRATERTLRALRVGGAQIKKDYFVGLA